MKMWRVCQAKFIATVGITERQVRTVFAKKLPCGLMEGEKRGGRQSAARDAQLRESVRAHINRFPRTESHYCRAKCKCQYLSSELSIAAMYRMYTQDHEEEEGLDVASVNLYRTVFKEMNLKFHSPKKDCCGVCETYIQGTPEEKENIEEEYLRHSAEKDKVRVLKESAKQRATTDSTFVASVFDLQQVIFLPKSSQSDIFYKRRLSNYNFTIYELASKNAWCFLTHEGIAGRGSNEVASYLFKYLHILDERGVKEVELYADGCVGQNKNTIVTRMLQSFIDQSSSIELITLRFFATNHGQSEGDSVHSVIQRKMNYVKEIMVPAHLASIIRMARINPRPYEVIESTTEDILDWKSLAQQSGILRVRTSQEGQQIDWTKLMGLQVSKRSPRDVKFKMSHCDEAFAVISIGGLRRNDGYTSGLPEKLYKSGPPKLSQAKYQDFMSLCTGKTPTIWHPDYRKFYQTLPH